MVLFIVDEFAMCLSLLLYTSKVCFLLIRLGDVQVTDIGSLFKCQMVVIFLQKSYILLQHVGCLQFVVHVLYLSSTLFKLVSGTPRCGTLKVDLKCIWELA